MNEKNFKIIIAMIFVLGLITGIVLKANMVVNPSLKYCKEYVVGEEGIKGNVDISYFESKHRDFEIGANKYGYAVFKNPQKAFLRLKNDYGIGIKIIQEEFHLSKLSNQNYKLYGTYGWQVSGGTESEREEASFVTSFMDIYENGFEKSS